MLDFIGSRITSISVDIMWVSSQQISTTYMLKNWCVSVTTAVSHPRTILDQYFPSTFLVTSLGAAVDSRRLFFIS